jgi:hypothetical protein
LERKLQPSSRVLTLNFLSHDDKKKKTLYLRFFSDPQLGWAAGWAGAGPEGGREVGARKPQVFEASKTWPLMIGWRAITEEAPSIQQQH